MIHHELNKQLTRAMRVGFYLLQQHTHTFISSRESEGDQRSNLPESFDTQNGVHLSRVGIGSEELDYLSPGNDNFLMLATAEITVDSLTNVSNKNV